MSASVEHEQLHADAARELVDQALATLHRRGERITAARRGVIDVLAAHHEHLTADQVAGLLARTGVHRATVYRTLETLASSGVATTRTLSQGALAYHLAASRSGHAHLHGGCRVCGAVIALPAGLLDQSVRAAADASGFVLDPVRSSLVGVCASCSS